MSMDVSQFHQVFFEESLEHLAEMETALLQLEGCGNDPEVVNVIFRGAHSIKGGAATFGFEGVAEFTHLMETLLEQVRSDKTTITAEIIGVLLESVDTLRDMIDALQTGETFDTARSASLQQQLTTILAENVEGPQQGLEKTRETSSSPETPITSGWHIQFRPHRQFFYTGNDPQRILRELGGHSGPS